MVNWWFYFKLNLFFTILKFVGGSHPCVLFTGGVSSVPFHVRLHLISLPLYYDDSQKRIKLRILNNSDNISFKRYNIFLISVSKFSISVFSSALLLLLLLSRFSAADAFKQTWPQNSPSSVVVFPKYRNTQQAITNSIFWVLFNYPFWPSFSP